MGKTQGLILTRRKGYVCEGFVVVLLWFLVLELGPHTLHHKQRPAENTVLSLTAVGRGPGFVQSWLCDPGKVTQLVQ